MISLNIHTNFRMALQLKDLLLKLSKTVSSTANCATAPCKALHGAIRIRSHNSNVVPHLAGNTVCYSARSVIE